MPEYLAPGVYVEERSFRAKVIEGVSTTTTGFIGPTRYGPVDLEPDVLTSLQEFERVYGDRNPLAYPDGNTLPNYMWHAARGFFEEGGKRLYVVRVFRARELPTSRRDEIDSLSRDSVGALGQPLVIDTGIAFCRFPQGVNDDDAITVRARWPGEAGRLRIRITLRLGQNILTERDGAPAVGALLDRDVVWLERRSLRSPPPGSPPGTQGFYIARREFDPNSQRATWYFYDRSGGAPPTAAHRLADLRRDPDIAFSDSIRVVTAAVTVLPPGEGELPQVWEGLALDPQHTRGGEPDSLSARFRIDPASQSKARDLPILIALGANLRDGLDVLYALNEITIEPKDPPTRRVLDALPLDGGSEDERSFEMPLRGGNDGERPGAGEYAGAAPPDGSSKTGLVAFEDVEDISIIAAPGSTSGYENGFGTDAQAIVNQLISHAERMRYRIAVIDCGDDQAITQVRAMRARIDSSYAALYYPWVRVLDPVSRREITLPPSGFVAGIYARNDVDRAVYKAPANEVVRSALGFEKVLNKAHQEVLNPEGINCFRFFEGRGNRLWGARTTSSDGEWKYVNVRRYFIYLERSIDRGTQWAVFEPNGEQLWANVRRTIEDFLLNEWQNGALLGDKPDKSFFVKCDRSTMTQNDLDNGRLVCLIGVAPLKPAEFVIFRIGQWTADRRI